MDPALQTIELLVMLRSDMERAQRLRRSAEEGPVTAVLGLLQEMVM